VLVREVDGDRPELKMAVVQESDLHGSPAEYRMAPHTGRRDRSRRPNYFQSAPAVSRIFSTASSIVKLFGFWIGGKSLNVSAHLPKIACDAWMI
jgi:hypothetical protein